jgi:hypothetical protein
MAPMLWALAAILLAEMGLVDLLLSHWIGPLALVLGLISGASLVLLIALILSFHRRPVALGPESLRVRTGFLVDTDVPFGEIAFAQSGYTPADYMPGSLLRASLLTHPNVVVLLRRDIDLPGPFGRTRNVHALALALDEPARFLLALNTAVKSAPAPRDSLAAA